MMKKLAFVLCVVLAISMCSFSFAEEAVNETVEVVVTPAPVVEPTKAPAKATEAPAAEPTVEATEAPAAEPTVEVTEAPSAQPTVEVTEAPSAEPTIEASEEPTETIDAEVTAEPTEETEATEAPVVERKVVVTVDAPSQLYYGDHVTLNAELFGYEGVSYTLQWQFSRDGNTWTDAQGANGLSYTFEVNEDNANTMWRLVVNVL